jgi:hypothetical protein
MTAPKPRRTQSRPLAPSGRAQTVQTSLSPLQAAWVASRGVTAAAYLRGLVEADMEEQESPEDIEAAFQRFLVRHADDIAKAGAIKVGDRVVWTSPQGCPWHGTVAEDYGDVLRIEWDSGWMKGNRMRSDLVKIGEGA